MIFCIVFTGESTLSVIFAVLLFLCLSAIFQNKYVKGIQYFLYMLFEVFLLVSWQYIWKNYISQNQGRFSDVGILSVLLNPKLVFAKGKVFWGDILFHLKRYLMINKDCPVNLQVYDKINFSFSLESWILIAILFFLLIYVFYDIIKEFRMESLEEENKRLNRNIISGLSYFVLSFFGVFMIAASRIYYHYLFIILPLATLLIYFVIGIFISEKR